MPKSGKYSDPVRKKFRIFFASLFGFLFLQFWFVHNVVEPYPSITMPMFGGVDGEGSKFRTMEIDVRFVFPDTTEHFKMEEFLSDMVESYRFHVLQRLMFPQPEVDPREDPGFQAWIRDRCEQLTGRKDAQSFEVGYTSVEIETAEVPPTYTRSEMGAFTHPFP